MRLVTYASGHGPCSGIAVDGTIVDTGAAARSAGLDEGVDWRSNRAVLAAGPAALSALARAAAHGDPVGTVETSELSPPVADPDKIICLGLNYRDHAEESGLEPPASPMLFAKFRNSLVGPRAPIVLPASGEVFDYEAELAVVIGRRCKDVAEAEALDVVAGVMAFNDVTARDVQHATSQWTAGKAIDTFGPCGPSLVLLDEVDDIQDLRVAARVNGATVQDGTTRDMIFPVAATIAFISRLMTLEPGDIIATGTPAGVGVSRDPQVLLHPGDVVEVEIGGIGVLSNPVVGPGGAAADQRPAPATAGA